MVLSLVSRGVVSGICLVLAKYWYDRREEKQQPQAADKNGEAESTSVQALLPLISAAGVDDQAALSAAAQLFSGDAADNNIVSDPQARVTKPLRGKTRATLDDDQRVEQALASRDLSSMETLLEDICDPVLRNRLLIRLVSGHYRRRSDAMHRATFYRVALLQMEEASSIMDGIEEVGTPRPDYLDAFKTMAIALDEDGSLDGAIAVCEMALSLGLQDGTKTGFEGRIDRLRRRQLRTDAVRPEKVLH
jgi:hypothetical protein